MDLLPQLRGAFCFVFMDEHTLYAARDPQGFRPLVLGRLDRGWVVASETAALDIVGASLIREVEPGRAHRHRRGRPALAAVRRRPSRSGCVFEYVYLARPDTTINGRGVHEARVEMGRTLAREHPVEADLVMPTPESGTPGRDRLRPGVRHPLRPGPGQELLRRAHLHRPVADDPPARHPAQAQPAARGHQGQAAGRRRRHHRPRQHPARRRPDAARGRGRRGPPADLRPAGEVAVLLRDRLPDPGRADRHRCGRRGDRHLDRRRLARLHQRGGHGRGDRAAQRDTSAPPASPAPTRSSCPTRAGSARTSSRRCPSTSTWTGCRSASAVAPRTPSPAPDSRPSVRGKRAGDPGAFTSNRRAGVDNSKTWSMSLSRIDAQADEIDAQDASRPTARSSLLAHGCPSATAELRARLGPDAVARQVAQADVVPRRHRR